jgi:putative transposase
VVRAGIVTDPAEYRWSSHRAYLGLDDTDLVDTDLVLSQFSKSRAQAIKLYQDFVMGCEDIGNLAVFYQVVDQRILGEDDFVAKVKKKVGEEPQSNENVLRNKTLEDVAKAIEGIMGVKIADLQSHKRSEQLKKARALFVQLSVLYVPAKRKRIARFLKREPGSLALIERDLTQEEFNRLRKRIRW